MANGAAGLRTVASAGQLRLMMRVGEAPHRGANSAEPWDRKKDSKKQEITWQIELMPFEPHGFMWSSRRGSRTTKHTPTETQR